MINFVILSTTIAALKGAFNVFLVRTSQEDSAVCIYCSVFFFVTDKQLSCVAFCVLNTAAPTATC
eukprot:m.373186 g.373186  ORF g.373186 m.373186 type:complete len:65 (+) comp20885_c0_seq4:1883-2077(+)